jgi:hypothetical protein
MLGGLQAVLCEQQCQSAALRTSSHPHLLPFRFAQARQSREHPRALQPAAAINGDACTVDVGGLVGNQIGTKISELVMLPARPAGFEFSQVPSIAGGTRRSHALGVGNVPGEIATVRIFFAPHSTARLWVIASTPALAIALGTT